MNKSGVKQAGEIITLVGAILETIAHSTLIFLTVGIWVVFAAIFIPLSWVSRTNSVKKESKGWMIYGIVQSAFFNTVGLVGYILLLVDKINSDKKEKEVKEE